MQGRTAILLDLDGTLIDSTSLILESFDHAWRTVLGRTLPRDAVLRTFGLPLKSAIEELALREMGEGGGRRERVELLLDCYRAHNRARHDELATAIRGAVPVVSILRERGYLIGIVSSKSSIPGNRALELTGLDRFVDARVFLEDTERHKPAPDPIHFALGVLAVERERAAYVGDSTNDIAAGRAAGVRTVAALWGPIPRSALEREKPDHLAESIEDLLDLFD